nr:hypothetical protein [Tanacetum cinerariifolium]
MRKVFRVEYNRTNGIDKRCITSYGYGLLVVSSGWYFVSAVLGQMTYLVADLTLDSASWGGSISSDSFLPSILLLGIIIVTVVIVVVILIVIVVAIVRVVIVVAIIRVVVIFGGVSSILKLSFVIIGEKKFQESDSDNTEGTTVGEAIGACSRGISNSLVASYACMTSIYGSSCKGEKTSVSKRYLVKSFEESGEVFLGEARK